MLSFEVDFQNVDYQKGCLLLVDKPKEWTSFDVVNKIKNTIRRKYNFKKLKVGHSGTLDPMATGLLLICTGGWTKELHQLLGQDKKYRAEITLGVETNTYDAEGEIVSEKQVPTISQELLDTIIKSFIGEIEQTPPIFSAIKQEGKPLYKLARAGQEVTVKSRMVKVFDITLIDFSENKIHLDIHCGSGFYVRSLAHDIGEKLECGAHLSALERTAIGSYSLADAKPLDRLVEIL